MRFIFTKLFNETQSQKLFNEIQFHLRWQIVIESH